MDVMVKEFMGVNLTYKEPLDDKNDESSATTVDSTAVPAGEVWEVTSVYAYTDGASGFILFDKLVGVASYRFKRVTSDVHLQWSGHIWLEEGDKIRATFGNSANILIHVLGVKRHLV